MRVVGGLEVEVVHTLTFPLESFLIKNILKNHAYHFLILQNLKRQEERELKLKNKSYISTLLLSLLLFKLTFFSTLTPEWISM